MNFEELYQIKDEIEQINKTYDIFDEEHRLSSKAAITRKLSVSVILLRLKALKKPLKLLINFLLFIRNSKTIL